MPPTALTRAKPKILAVHRWLALVAGLFLMCQGLTGSLIAYRYELNRALHPGILTIMAMSGYFLWILRTLRWRNGQSAGPVMDGR